MSRLSLLVGMGLAVAGVSYLSAQIAPLEPPVPVPPKARTILPPRVVTPSTAIVPDPNALKFDAESKDFNARPGDASASFTFSVTNVSRSDVSINSLRTSCGCTVAQLPPLPNKPFVLAAGSNVAINVTMDLRGKMGAVTKSISVETSAGFKSLLVRANIPQPGLTPTAGAAQIPAVAGGMGERAKNIQAALADRQAVFKGDCAKCHVEKGVGKMGKELYVADCAVCHDSEHRAAMVTDLKVPRSARDLSFWQKWIMEGKPGTMMPAFAAIHGGPLTQEQIDSLTVYLYENYPKNPTNVIAQRILPVPALQKN